MSVSVRQGMIQEGVIRFWISESVIKPLDNQRIVPQPAISTLSAHGILYNFPVQGKTTSVEFALEPSIVGLHQFIVKVPGSTPVTGHILVVP